MLIHLSLIFLFLYFIFNKEHFTNKCIERDGVSDIEIV